FRAADYVDQAAARNPANYRRSDVRLLAQVQPRYIWQDDGIFPDCQPREQQAGAGIFADDHRGSDLRGGSRGHSLTFNAAEDDDGSIRRDAIIINCAKVIEQETDAAGHNRGVGFTRLRTAEAGIRENLAFPLPRPQIVQSNWQPDTLTQVGQRQINHQRHLLSLDD